MGDWEIFESPISNLFNIFMLSELDNYLQRLEDLRQQVIDLIADLPVEALNWRPTERIEGHATNSLAVLAAHIAGAEHFWIGEIIGGLPPTRNRPAEFAVQAAGAAELVTLLQKSGQQTRSILAALSETDLNGAREVEGRMVAVRWGILHIIDHTALHLGHMQITYQLWMDGRSKPSPHWQQRLPRDKN